MTPASSTARDEILARIRRALTDTRDTATTAAPAHTHTHTHTHTHGSTGTLDTTGILGIADTKNTAESSADIPDTRGTAEHTTDLAPDLATSATAIPRDYRVAHAVAHLTDLLAENLADYRAKVHRCTEPQIPSLLARLLTDRGARTAAIPDGLPEAWLCALRTPGSTVTLVPDSPPLTAHDLDTIDSVISTCALAIAETGTIVLNAGPGQGRRMLTLVPDHHICVVRCPDQVVAAIPQALPLLDPGRPQTWIAGPSATSDIELDRVEGVHGPRRLDVILVEADLA